MIIKSNYEFTMPVHTVSEANGREYWAIKAKRVKNQRQCAYIATIAALKNKNGINKNKVSKIVITLTRIGKRNLDGDNLQSSMKAIRDGIADAI